MVSGLLLFCAVFELETELFLTIVDTQHTHTHRVHISACIRYEMGALLTCCLVTEILWHCGIEGGTSDGLTEHPVT